VIGEKMKELIIASAAFALFILCPRMAGMTNVISNATHVELVKVVVFGTLFSLPDFAAAFAMREISMKAGMETLIIAMFVILGVKVASVVSGWVS
jgi:hypothetical protein